MFLYNPPPQNPLWLKIIDFFPFFFSFLELEGMSGIQYLSLIEYEIEAQKCKLSLQNYGTNQTNGWHQDICIPPTPGYTIPFYKNIKYFISSFSL